MSELKDCMEKIIRSNVGMIEVGETASTFVLNEGQSAMEILTAFKAHIEGFKPDVPLRWRKARERRVSGSGAVASSLTTGFIEGVEEYYKALMESLK